MSKLHDEMMKGLKDVESSWPDNETSTAFMFLGNVFRVNWLVNFPFFVVRATIKFMIADKRQRTIQIYDALRTARLNVLYYEESELKFTRLINWHNGFVALTASSSPLAFLGKSTTKPFFSQIWFYATLVTMILGILKPVLKLEDKQKLYVELRTHYCDLYLQLKALCEDIAADCDLTDKSNSRFEGFRDSLRSLELKGPPPDKNKVIRLEAAVNREIDINAQWLPDKKGELEMSQQEETRKHTPPPEPAKQPERHPTKDHRNYIGDSTDFNESVPSRVQPTQEWPRPKEDKK